jgi:hypothetical protein
LLEKGPLYQIGTNSTFSLGFAAVSLGAARARWMPQSGFRAQNIRRSRQVRCATMRPFRA